jgi:hypothetical protein
MARVTPEQAAAKWVQRLSASTEDIKRGVLGVTEAPGVSAARRKDLWLARVTQSADKWARRVSSVSLQDWQNAMVNKGVSRIASGAQEAQPKMASFMADFLPYVDSGVAKVKAMPKGSLEAGIARSAEMIRHNAAYVRKG